MSATALLVCLLVVLLVAGFPVHAFWALALVVAIVLVVLVA